MPTTATSARHISLAAVVRVISSVALDPEQPYLITSRCNFLFEKDGFITIPIVHWSMDGVLTTGSTAFCAGELFFPPGDEDGHVDASVMHMIADSEMSERVLLKPASVSALGPVTNVIGKSWFMEVGNYDRMSKSQKTFNIEVMIPDTKRYEKLKAPTLGRSIYVRGTLASVSIYEEVANINLESVTYISMSDHLSNASPNSSPQAGSGGVEPRVAGRSKRQLRSERLASPIKKVKVGPASSFKGDGEPTASGSQVSGDAK